MSTTNEAPSLSVTPDTAAPVTPAVPPAGVVPVPPALHQALQDVATRQQRPAVPDVVTPAPIKAFTIKEDTPDEEIEKVEADKPLELTAKQFKDRIRRGTSTYLKRVFGTDDPDLLKQKIAKLSEYEEQAEQTRLAQMSEKEQLEEKLRQADERASEAEKRWEEAKFERSVNEGEQMLRSHVQGIVDPDMSDEAIEAFKRENRSKSHEELDAMTASEVRQWFQELVKRKPKYGAEVGAPLHVVPAPVPKQGFTNGSSGGPKPVVRSGTMSGQRTFAKNQPNSIPDDEVKKELKSRGISWK